MATLTARHSCGRCVIELVSAVQTLAAPQPSSYIAEYLPVAPPPTTPIGIPLDPVEPAATAADLPNVVTGNTPPADDGQEVDLGGSGDGGDDPDVVVAPPADDSLSTGGIVGIGLAAVVAVLAILVLLAGWRRSQNKKRRHAPAPEAASVRLPGFLRNCSAVLTLPTDAGCPVYGHYVLSFC